MIILEKELEKSSPERIMEKLFAVPYRDARERRHVVAILAATPTEAIEKLIAFQAQWPGQYYATGFNYDILPEEGSLVEINPDADEPVQVLWHEDYD